MKSGVSISVFLVAVTAFVVATFFAVTYSDRSWAQEHEQSHQEIFEKWHSSHHQKSMLEATPDTVFGNFDDVDIEINGVSTSFFKRNNAFWVRTADVAGSPKEFEIEYVFGFDPLQQYLVKTENGKYQVLPFSWDSRPSDQGGQRWFHIYGDDHIPHNDRLHWTQPLQNWNGMCADCHSTGLERNYNVSADQFDTTWDTINVSCASCHQNSDYSDYSYSLSDSGWSFEEGQNTAIWVGEQRPKKEIEVCAACHSRRTPITDGINPDVPYLDQFSPTLITTPEYYPDGQVKEEDYVWGSFLQSKMYSKGVVCSDCHDPHSLELKAPGNELCAQCHLPSYFDTPDHHNHIVGSEAAQCVTCHMPETTFMQVDARNDHSFRIPRPDLTDKTSSPDVCTSCHTDLSSSEAAEAINTWPNGALQRNHHYGEIFNAVDSGLPGAETNLKELINNAEMPAIIRATGYSLLSRYPNENTISHITQGLRSIDPLIRLGAVRATDFITPARKEQLLRPLLNDEFKVIRVEAFEKIANERLSPKIRNEYLTAAEQVMWRGEGRYNLALFYQRVGKAANATENYLGAQKVDPYFPASYVNLADLFRNQNNDRSGAMILDRGLSLMPGDPDINFSKALNLVRERKPREALQHLDTAFKNAPENARYAYVYAVALRDLGQPSKAIEVLRKSYSRHNTDPNINTLLMETYRSEGNWKEALIYAENLSKLLPKNSNIRNILADLKNKTGKNQ